MGPRWRSYKYFKMGGKKAQWYVVYTKPRWEKKTNGLLNAQGIETYCPMNRVRKKWSDRLKWVDEPLFKSYVFVKIGGDQFTKVRMVPGVLNFVYWLGKPAVVKENEIVEIRRFLGEYTDVQLEPLELMPESRVVILSGVLMDREATVRRVHKNSVEVVIESLGYKLVAQVDKKMVKPVKTVN
jgi:transcription antitermination factor NusG